MAEGELNAILYSLSNEMRAHDLQNLKHLCHGKIPLAELEKAQTSCDLFRIMRHKMFIRPGNLDYLESMLEKIGRADLVRKIQTSGGDRTMQTESGLPSNPLVAVNYKGFLLSLSDELTQDDVDALKFIADLPSGIDEKIEKGRDFFKYMMQAGTIGPTQLSHLADLLQKIHRMDLAVKVRKFQSTPEDNMRVTTAGGFNQTAAPQGNTQLPKPVIVEKQPTTHQMGGARSPSIPLMSPADFSRPRPSEPRFPVQAMPNPGELVDPLQAIGIDNVDEMPSYPMTQRPRGIALIISNEHFPGNPTLRDRQGNVKDVDQLQELWTFLNFHVVVRQDLASQEIYSVMREFSTLDHGQYDCFVCCLLSHGANGGIFGTDSELVEIKDITALFKGVACPSLHNKPKLFFIQACRGQDFDRGAQIEMDATELNPEDSMRHNAEPNESHFLLGYATPPGYVSWRSQIHGSWYISKLCEVFRKYCDQFDVMTMMVKVNDEVSEAYTRQGYKQCPAPVVTLRRRIYFNNN